MTSGSIVHHDRAVDIHVKAVHDKVCKRVWTNIGQHKQVHNLETELYTLISLLHKASAYHPRHGRRIAHPFDIRQALDWVKTKRSWIEQINVNQNEAVYICR